MSLNIKNEETYELVKELAAMTGVSLTAAVKVAVRNEIERERSSRRAAGQRPRKRSEVLRTFAEEFSSKVRNPIHSWEVDALLYDENGLPK